MGRTFANRTGFVLCSGFVWLSSGALLGRALISCLKSSNSKDKHQTQKRVIVVRGASGRRILPVARVVGETQRRYLHDTNEKGLFSRAQRALSHGCVRVEQARGLAAWALGVSEEAIDAMISKGTTYSVPLAENIPVSLVYYTRFPDERGQVASHPDIYTSQQAQASRR